MVRRAVGTTMRGARRVAIALMGGTVILLGVAMIVLPGPALLVIPAGLGILSLEFVWARRWLQALQARGRSLSERWSSREPSAS